MCSIDEAWAGQTFFNKPVVSQGDMHKAYMSLPDDISMHNNEFSLKTNSAPNTKYLTRGINSKLSREPRVPIINRNSDNANINLSSTMPPYNNYGGIDNVPDYMSIYNNAAPEPNMSGEQFSDIENAYNVSNTINNFMDLATKNNLLTEDNDTERRIINTKINNKEKRTNFMNIKQYNKYDSSDKDYNSSTSTDVNNIMSSNNTQVLIILQQLISKLDRIEHNLHNLHNNQSRNMYDIVLYVIFGMILSFILYSIMSNKK